MSRPSTFNTGQKVILDNHRGQFYIYGLDSSGAIDYSKIISTFKNILIQEVMETDDERIQLLLADSPKLYVYGKQHKFLQVAGVLVDTQSDQYDAHSYTNLTNFFNTQAKLSICAKNNWRLVFPVAHRIYVGAVAQWSMSVSADTPHIAGVNFIMYLTDAFNYD